MYDIKELEELWKRYNRKKYKPWLIFGTLFTLIVLLVLSLVYFRPPFLSLLEGEKKETSHTPTKPKKQITQKQANVILDGPLMELEDKETSKNTDSPLVEVSPDNNTAENIPQPPKSLQIQVVKADDPKTYEEVEKRFRLGHDVDDSLFLARAYYAKGKYKKAEYWALQTNKIDENIEDSWLIFTKAKVKRGQKNEALRILRAYIKRTDSAEAKVLLKKIKRGEV